MEKIQNGVGTNLATLVQYVSTFVAGIVAALYLNWEMTLILLAMTPFIVAPSGVFNQVYTYTCRVPPKARQVR